jgi:hypothetical protein
VRVSTQLTLLFVAIFLGYQYSRNERSFNRLAITFEKLAESMDNSVRLEAHITQPPAEKRAEWESSGMTTMVIVPRRTDEDGRPVSDAVWREEFKRAVEDTKADFPVDE